MDQHGVPEPSIDVGFSFFVDLINGYIYFDGGYSTTIRETLDTQGDETDDRERIRFIVFVMPPDDLWITVDLSLLERLDAPVIH